MNASLRIQVLEILQWMGFAIVMTALPFSNFFISFGTFWLVGVWILQQLNAHFTDKSAKKNLTIFLTEPLYWIPTIFFFLGIIGLLWSEDFGFASWDLRMKLPMLFMPFLVVTLAKMPASRVDNLYRVFIAALVVSTAICLLVYFGYIDKKVKNVRDISIFISHIRLSMLLVLGMVILCHRWVCKGKGVVLSIVIFLLFIYFLWVIESITGFILLSALLAYSLLNTALKAKEKWFRVGTPLVIFSLCVVFVVYFIQQYKTYFEIKDNTEIPLPLATANGEPYTHYLENNQLENGHLIMRNIAWNELKKGWNQRSSIDFDSTDLKGNVVKWTLIRYLTSLGMKKDKEALDELAEEDIENIEKGIPSAIYFTSSGIDRRLDKIFFELDNYRNGGSPNGHSVFQRFEFWKTGFHVFKRHPWIGVGTGDLKKEFLTQYEIDASSLVEKNRLRAHHQYLTYFVSYGLLGGIIFILGILYPFTRKWVRANALFMGFYLICLLSFFTEDTLETQVGVTFYAFFYPFLLLYGREEKSKNGIR